MTTPAGCSAWAGIEDLPTTVVDLHDPARWCSYLALATDILWAGSGRRWRGAGGTATVSLRAAPPRPGEAEPWAYDRSWGACGCYQGVVDGWPMWGPWQGRHVEPAKVRLPHPDVTTITSVTLDGAAFTSWRLDGSWLTRTDGQGWPSCGDRVTVVYAYGLDPPRAGVLACAELAAEIGIAAAPDADVPCRLPSRVQSVTRQGIAFEIADPQTYLDRGLTGITTIDLWLKSINPSGRAQRARVWSPDAARATRSTA